MTIKSEVQGVVQALFGAYAGGYLVELTAEATANGTGAVAARLASVQGIILGKDLSTNASFVDTILSNMGVPSTNAAYAAASKWANDELTAGASRADIVSTAVAFLSGIAAGTIVDSNYTAVATAFAAKVEAGVTYSETAAGAKVLSVTALQTAAGFTETTNLSASLSALTAAQEAASDFVDAWGLKQDPVIKAADSTATMVYDAAETAELGVDAVIASDGATLGAGALAYNVAAETSGSGDKTEDARLIIIKEAVAVQEVALDKAVATATTNMNAVSTSLKSAVDSYVLSLTAQTAANLASTVAQTATSNAVAALNAGSADITAATWNNLTNTVSITSTAQGAVTAVYNATTGVWTYTGAGAVADGATSGTPSFDLTAVKAAVVAEIAAGKAATSAATNVQLRLDSIAKLSETQFAAEQYTVSVVIGGVTYYAATVAAAAPDAADVSPGEGDEWTQDFALAIGFSKVDAATIKDAAVTTAPAVVYKAGSAIKADFELTNGVGNLYAVASKAVTDFDKAVVKLDAAVAKVDAARADSTSLAALDKAVTAATKVLTDQGYAVKALADTDFVSGSAKNDVFTLGTLDDDEAATINDFSFAGDDVLYIGNSYTYNTGKTTTGGDDAVLEVFAKQDGANVVLTFETETFGTNAVPTVDAAGDLTFTVTLTGVILADVSISNGYIQA